MLTLTILLASLQFHVLSSEFANAVYHVSCMTGRVACTNRGFTEFWNTRQNVTREDGAAFDEWRDTFNRLEKATPASGSAPLLPNYPAFYPSIRLRNEILSAAFVSRTPEEFEKRATKIVPAADAQRLRKIAAHVQLRLRPWWEKTGRLLAESQAKGMLESLRSQSQSMLSDIGGFLDAKVPTGDIYVHLIPSTNPASTDATATFFRNHVTIEITNETVGKDAAWIVTHELTHALYDAVPHEKHIELMHQFVNSKRRYAQPMYAYLNEAIATGVQLLMFDRLGKKDDDPYRHLYIPRLARAAKPIIKEALEKRRKILDGFVARYIEAASQELKDEQESARFLLASTAVLTGTASVRDEYASVFQPLSWVTSEEEWRRFANLSAVRIVAHSDLPPGVPDAARLKEKRAFAYVTPHGAIGHHVVVSGREPTDVTEALKRLAALKSLPGSGVALAID